MSVRTEAHHTVSPLALADWLERQGVDRWWNVDGDPLLTRRLSFPCPADELAAELRHLNRTLLVHDRSKSARGFQQMITPRELDTLVTRLGDNLVVNGARPGWANDRVFYLCWENCGDDWLLIEDEETTERSRQDALLAQGSM